jgi:hypothetical protein
MKKSNVVMNTPASTIGNAAHDGGVAAGGAGTPVVADCCCALVVICGAPEVALVVVLV